MVLSAAGAAAIAVPDFETWLLWGHDLAAHGVGPAPATTAADVLVCASAVPAPLAGAVARAWRSMPPWRSARTLDAPLDGERLRALLDRVTPAGSGHEEAGAHGGGHEHGHDHGDMMRIEGPASADGLVMEPLDLSLGPVAPALPAGLAVDLSLDGDVVATCRVSAALDGAEHAARGPDPSAGVAWAVAERVAREAAAGGSADAPVWRRLAAVELERAVSHLAWLARLGRLLGWARLSERALGVARAALPAWAVLRGTALGGDPRTGDGGERAGGGEAARLDACAREGRRLASWLERSRVARWRLAGLAVVDAGLVRELGLAGPIARAAGAGEDARGEQDAYRHLKLEVCRAAAGDAHARTIVRAREAPESLRLAAAALRLQASPDHDWTPAPAAFTLPGGGIVEGPRGPVRVRHAAAPPGTGPARDAPGSGDAALDREAPGAAAALDLAGELAGGLELSAALAAIASLDLSPWRPPA